MGWLNEEFTDYRTIWLGNGGNTSIKVILFCGSRACSVKYRANYYLFVFNSSFPSSLRVNIKRGRFNEYLL